MSLSVAQMSKSSWYQRFNICPTHTFVTYNGTFNNVSHIDHHRGVMCGAPFEVFRSKAHVKNKIMLLAVFGHLHKQLLPDYVQTCSQCVWSWTIWQVYFPAKTRPCTSWVWPLLCCKYVIISVSRHLLIQFSSEPFQS